MKKYILSGLTATSLFLSGCGLWTDEELLKVDEDLIIIAEDDDYENEFHLDDFYLLNDNDQTLLVSFALEYSYGGNPNDIRTIEDELIVIGHGATEIIYTETQLEENLLSYEIISWIEIE